MKRFKWNPRIPRSALKRFLEQPERLLGTFWSLPFEYHQYRLYRVVHVEGTRVRLQGIDTLNLREGSTDCLLGALSQACYEGRNVAWARPGSLVRDQDAVYYVQEWQLYRALVRWPITDPPQLLGHLTRQGPHETKGLIRGQLQPCENTPMLRILAFAVDFGRENNNFRALARWMTQRPQDWAANLDPSGYRLLWNFLEGLGVTRDGTPRPEPVRNPEPEPEPEPIRGLSRFEALKANT